MARWPNTVQQILDKALACLRLASNALLVGLFLIMLLVAAGQVIARELGFGFYWGDDLVRMSVLWVTMVGAVIAVGDSKHIRIDLVDRFLSKNLLRVVQAVAYLLTAAVCALFGYFSIDMIGWDYVDQTPGVGKIPAWIFELVIPVSAFLMTIRFILQAFKRETT